MARIIHARLDDQTEKILAQIERTTGWNDSQIVREGIKALRSLLPARRDRQIVSLAGFASGKRDLGSNKKHLEGFGC